MTDTRTQILDHLRSRAPADKVPLAAFDAVPGMRENLVERFISCAEQSMATCAIVDGMDHLVRTVRNYIDREKLPLEISISGEYADLPWAREGLAMVDPDPLEDGQTTITGCIAGVAETGTIVVCTSPDHDTKLNFLAATSIIVVKASQIVERYEQAWQIVPRNGDRLPRAVNFITGPSRTADIEQTLELGAHGPKSVHLIIIK